VFRGERTRSLASREALFRHVESIEFATEPDWRLGNTLHGLDGLPVKPRPVAA
jgi:hypothetical protein